MSLNKSVLIVGGAGYIGGFLTDALNQQGYDVTVFDNLLYEDRFLKATKFIFGDIRDTNKLAAIINDYDVVVVLAAMVGDGACAAEPYIAKHINEIATNALADVYTRPGGKIVFTSTCSVYGKNDQLIDETATPNPLSVYAETKLNAERYILQTREDALVFRLGTLYGTGDQFSRPRLDLVGNVLTMRATLGEPLSVFGGEQWRPLLHVRDVTSAIVYGIKNNISGLFNLSDNNYTIRQLAETIRDIVNPQLQIAYTEMSFEDQRNYRVSNAKVLQTGWRPLWTLEEGIRQVNELFTERRLRNHKDPVYSCESYLRQKYGQ